MTDVTTRALQTASSQAAAIRPAISRSSSAIASASAAVASSPASRAATASSS